MYILQIHTPIKKCFLIFCIFIVHSEYFTLQFYHILLNLYISFFNQKLNILYF